MLWRRRWTKFLVPTAFALWFYGFFVISSNTNITNTNITNDEFPDLQNEPSKEKTERRMLCTDQSNHTWNLPAVPHFILAGTQKGGTTALRNLLVKHPKMVASMDFERHFFDAKLFRYIANTYQSSEIKDEWLCDIQRQYIQSTFHPTLLDAADEGLFFFEKTPSYLIDPQVPALVKKVCPWARIVVILRDPIERAFSHYKMEREKLRVKIDFSTAVQQEISLLRDHGLSNAPPIPNSTTDQGIFLEKLETGLFLIPEMDQATSDNQHKLFFQRFPNTNFLQRGLYSIQLKRWLKYFALGDSLLVLKFEDLQAHPSRVYDTILDFLGAPRFSLHVDDFQKSYQTRGQYRRKGMVHPPMENATRAYLKRFFQPYNEQLVDLLGTNFY